jgi:hypothetical protein
MLRLTTAPSPASIDPDLDDLINQIVTENLAAPTVPSPAPAVRSPTPPGADSPDEDMAATLLEPDALPLTQEVVASEAEEDRPKYPLDAVITHGQVPHPSTLETNKRAVFDLAHRCRQLMHLLGQYRQADLYRQRNAAVNADLDMKIGMLGLQLKRVQEAEKALSQRRSELVSREAQLNSLAADLRERENALRKREMSEDSEHDPKASSTSRPQSLREAAPGTVSELFDRLDRADAAARQAQGEQTAILRRVEALQGFVFEQCDFSQALNTIMRTMVNGLDEIGSQIHASREHNVRWAHSGSYAMAQGGEAGKALHSSSVLTSMSKDELQRRLDADQAA